MNDVNDIQHDVFNYPLSEFSREIIKREAASAETLKILKGWDGKMTADSVGATIADRLNACVGNKISAENKPAFGYWVREAILPRAIPSNDKTWLPKGFDDWDTLLKTCDVEVTKSLRSNTNFGEDPENWAWGKDNEATFDHPLAIVPLIGGQFKAGFTNVDGSGQTPNVGKNVSMRFIAKPANWDETRQVIPLGQSGNPQSQHWRDQFESWRTGKPEIFPFSRGAVLKATQETVLLTP